MKAIDTLFDEHELIVEYLDLLSVASRRILEDNGPPRAFLEKAVEFARDFADQYHHYKEEYVMFGLLAQKHDGALDAQIERHRLQHEQCRDLIQTISESLPGYARGLNTESRRLHRSLEDYEQTLRSHIVSENRVFFPMVAKAISQAEDDRLHDEFAKYESKVGSGVRERFRRNVAEMSSMLNE